MARRIGYVVGALVLAGSAVNVFLYLFRWEWNRALIAGMFFVMAEIGIVGALILERLRRIEHRIGDEDRRDILQTLEENPTPARESFAWLTSDGDNLGVFIPFLLGAGLVVSGIAWVVERVAHATAAPVIDRHLAMRLAPVAFPRGGLLGTPEPPARGLRTSWSRIVIRTVFWVLAALLAVRAIDGFVDATQTRPDTLVPGSSSVVTFELESNGSVNGLDAARSLWATCWGTVPSDLSGAITHAGGTRYVMTLQPALGSHGERRLRGCLSDVTIDNLKGRVVSVTN